MDLAKVLNKALIIIQAKRSSIICIVMLKHNILYSINVGNSGFMIFKANKLVYKSSTQQYYFNIMYQLGKNESCNQMRLAKKSRFMVLLGDIIVLGTNGFWIMYTYKKLRILRNRK